MKIAVIGAGISGLACAWKMAQQGLNVTLFEAGNWYGGHSHTVDVTLDGVTHGVDTGFLVFNQKTYPNLIRLFAQLEVPVADSDMSFSVKLPLSGQPGGAMLEWAGSNLDTVFAQRSNLLRPRFWRMLRDILRFNRQCSALALGASMPEGSLHAFLQQHEYSREFRNWYLLPMAACIWSCPTGQMLDFPVATFIRFCHNHGLLQVSDRPQWRTVRGGARIYVEKLLAGIPKRRLACPVLAVHRAKAGANLPAGCAVQIVTLDGTQHFDQVVFACHSDQALALLKHPTDDERAVLSQIRYQNNHAILHTDQSCLPGRKKAWSAWNYQSTDGNEPEVCVHYLLNRLQPLPFKTPLILSLNPVTPINPDLIIDRYEYAHPVFDAKAVAAQARLDTISGHNHSWYAGAWTGYGFHEDGLKSGLAVAKALSELAGHGAAAPSGNAVNHFASEHHDYA